MGDARSSSDRTGASTVPDFDKGPNSAAPTCPVTPVSNMRISIHHVFGQLLDVGQTAPRRVSFRDRGPVGSPINRQLGIVPPNDHLGFRGIVLVAFIEK